MSLESNALTTVAFARQYLNLPSTNEDNQVLEFEINLVSAAMEHYCDRTFHSTVYSAERYDGDGTTRILLRNYPVTAIGRIAIGTQSPILVVNTSTDAAYATISVSTTGMTLTIVGGANAGTDTLTFAAFPTLGVLDDAVTALGKNWAGTTSTAYTSTPSTQLLVSMGQDCMNASAVLEIPYQPIADYNVMAARGEVYYSMGFTPGVQNVIIDYTAGYAAGAIPMDLQLACLQILAVVYRNGRKDPTLRSERIGDYSYTNAAGDVTGILGQSWNLLPLNCARWVRHYAWGT